MLWVDKYRPHDLDTCDLHVAINQRLQTIVQNNDFPHMLFYGPSGAGKKTRVMALLAQVFGSGVDKLKVETRSFKFKDVSVSTELTIVSSNYHIEINPSDAGYRDRNVVQEVIKEIAQSQTLEANPHVFNDEEKHIKQKEVSKGFRVLILTDADKMSRDAQQGLRRTMEKYSSTCRLILICESSCNIIQPLRSRCLAFRIPSPHPQDIAQCLIHICKKEKYTISNDIALRIVNETNRNIRRSILALECLSNLATNQIISLLPHQPVPTPDWETFISKIAHEIIAEQTPAKLLFIRGKLYELICNCIPPSLIFKRLVQHLCSRVDRTLKCDIVHWAAYYEHQMGRGSKAIMFLEAFIAKFMSLHKKYVMAMVTY